MRLKRRRRLVRTAARTNTAKESSKTVWKSPGASMLHHRVYWARAITSISIRNSSLTMFVTTVVLAGGSVGKYWE